MSGFTRGASTLAGVARGKSGTLYGSIQQAIDIETEDKQIDQTQSGTTVGIIQGSIALSGEHNRYRNYFAVMPKPNLTDKVGYYASRVVAYDGIKKILTLEDQVDFGVGSEYILIDPPIITLLRDTQEDVVISKSVILNLSGFGLIGKLDHGNGDFVWIRGGSGLISDGFKSLKDAYIRIDDVSISKRMGENYSIFMTKPNALGRLVQNAVRNAGTVVGA